MTTPSSPLIYRNAMESLVTEEIERQFRTVAPKVAKFLNRAEVAAFALNRLPALYATNERGWKQQCIRGRRDYGEKITLAVRQGLAAVQRDPWRTETPLNPLENNESLIALQQIQELLQRKDLSWQNLPTILEQVLVQTARGEITWKHPHTGVGNTRLPWAKDVYRF